MALRYSVLSARLVSFILLREYIVESDDRRARRKGIAIFDGIFQIGG